MSSAPDRAWSGILSGRRHEPPALCVDAPLQPSPTGGSGTFLALASDGAQWWVKPPNNLQGGKVIVTEYVVGRCGALIGAPVCDVQLIAIPPEIAGWEFRPGTALVEGVGHASLMVPGARESRNFEARDRDDNSRRHAGVLALYDWCWGGDDQWLYCIQEDERLYSHDHGWYLPETGPEWDVDSLRARLAENHLPPYPTAGLDAPELEKLAEGLRGVSRESLQEILFQIPPSWPVTDLQLEALGYFLEIRKQDVSARLVQLAGGLP